MSNSKQAFPQIQIQCRDRVRNFCLNLGAFRALEEHLIAKSGDEDFSIVEDFDWSSNKIEDLSLLMWAGLFTDAKKDEEIFTIERCEDLVDFVNIAECRPIVEASLTRLMTSEQHEKIKAEAEKKSKKRLESRNKRKDLRKRRIS